MSVFGVILVHIFPHSDWITPNTDTFHLVLVKNLQSIIFTKIVNDEKLCFWRSTIHNYYKLEVQQVNYNWKHSPLKSTFKQIFRVWTYLITQKKKKRKKKNPKAWAFFFTIVVFLSLVTLTAVKSSTKIKLRVHSGDNQTSYQKAFILVYNILIVNN